MDPTIFLKADTINGVQKVSALETIDTDDILVGVVFKNELNHVRYGETLFGIVDKPMAEIIQAEFGIH